MPHEMRFNDVELHLRNELARQADLIHVMCDTTLEVVNDLYRLPEDRTVVIPHSGYVGVYPDAADRDTARTNLGLDEEDITRFSFWAESDPTSDLTGCSMRWTRHWKLSHVSVLSWLESQAASPGSGIYKNVATHTQR